MSIPTPSRQIIIRIVRKSDGKTMSMNIAENENHKVKFIKSELKRLFHTNGKFRLFYQNRHIKSRHKLAYYASSPAALPTASGFCNGSSSANKFSQLDFSVVFPAAAAGTDFGFGFDVG
ncbi:unnamed protein product [Rotaria magnacalcarata]|uniref:Ubiquitin-like domain-containing protein n=1 Tax=Rotaria magnacalcarata TaxID=392030 RepID=A0A8S3CMA4_9BILA|nr:unnamed protein product [Rotaria magnacalcarata]